MENTMPEVLKASWNLQEEIAKAIKAGRVLGFDFNGREKDMVEEIVRKIKAGTFGKLEGIMPSNNKLLLCFAVFLLLLLFCCLLVAVVFLWPGVLLFLLLRLMNRLVNRAVSSSNVFAAEDVNHTVRFLNAVMESKEEELTAQVAISGFYTLASPPPPPPSPPEDVTPPPPPPPLPPAFSTNSSGKHMILYQVFEGLGFCARPEKCALIFT
ncbi:hypothetical protein Q3G72_034949 [Acer saccharum]|nr:hypothetical protein Q3G72_034949 [Acer saccharum]